MFCPKCGRQLDDSDAFCRSCGFAISGGKPASGEPLVRTAVPTLRDAEERIRRSGEATASLVLGLFSFIPVVGLLAVIFGHLARATIRRSGGRLLGDGMAVFGLTLGYLSLGVWIIYGLSLLVSQRSTWRTEQRAFDERSAIMLLRTINTAATTYDSTYSQGYPANLAAMGPPKPGMKESHEAAGFVTEAEASGTHFGYRFTYVAGDEQHGRVQTYTVHADPLKGEKSREHFFTDQSGVIRERADNEADAESPPLSGSTE